jgi:hypothetical protein
MVMDQAKHDKLMKLFQEVLLNYQAQQRWQDNVDPDFIDCLEVIIRKFDRRKSQEQWLRTGVMLGAVYEQWKQRNKEASRS